MRRVAICLRVGGIEFDTLFHPMRSDDSKDQAAPLRRGPEAAGRGYPRHRWHCRKGKIYISKGMIFISDGESIK